MQVQRDVLVTVLHIDEHVASTVRTADRHRSHPLTHNHTHTHTPTHATLLHTHTIISTVPVLLIKRTVSVFF